ncbi:OstA-like protein [Arthrospiribacter ruber]|uniref:Organic solvent tolerance protein OstA n=1 Tax=Arthrospiribacter ruber TaxID=2487934 RepID=A0A951IT16_9BACT|nr:OstA-like protein [Arthrospiribacter ruber]MBW3467150.1 organic solvent tolerance protein OstA [Arthrospiribacter ruber]
MIKNSLFTLLLFIGIFPTLSMAQDSNTLEIQQADLLQGATGFERLINNVRMKHQNSLIYCDSAHFFRTENRAKLFGNVRIVDTQDPVTTTSRYAEYDGDTKIAKLRNNVVFKNEETTLYTDFLDYNRATGVANYFNEGKVVDSTNVLTSINGVYETRIEKITFTENVVLVNPDYTLKTNFMIYMTVPKTAETVGLTNIVSKEGDKLNAQKGSFYDTERKIFRFYDGDVETATSKVYAEVLYYDENQKYYEGRTDVSVYNKERDVEIFGEEGKYWEDRKYSIVYGNALVQKYFEMDTMYVIADTLISQDSENEEERHLLAFRNVKMIKSDLYGKSDSLAYIYSDSTIHLYRDPVLWNDKSQITADSVRFLIANEEIDRIYLNRNAFNITKDTLGNFNQMKGRKMTGYFLDGQISRFHIEGNGESIYYDVIGDSTLRGMNKMLCANIMMFFEEGNIHKINWLVKPEGEFNPPHLIKEEDKLLDGFVWREEEKPSMEDIFAWRTPRKREEKPEDLFEQPEVFIPRPTDEEIQKLIDEKTKNGSEIKMLERPDENENAENVA